MENSHILHVEIRVARTDTAWPVIACLNELTFRIKVVNYRVRVLLLRCREYHNLEVLIGSLETLSCKRSDIDTCQNRLGLLRELNGDYYFRIVGINVIHAVNKSLIEIKNYSFSL